MRKIIFSGISMFISSIGIITIIFVCLYCNKIYGVINGSTKLLIYIDWFGLTPIFAVFCLIGILGFCIGLWGVFSKDKDNFKK
ncbi:hypothetical protein G9F71_024685 [Clostridium sp. FP2]|uniref:hypothetical protein n=1 Tax=Clostridium sp. FP2 TaxID=2724481 RepID=UPI0013E9517D|nr:hypothetical protein [Clostridium sp. FP2]MBZ9626005.1 hypothetical protein [Clostridium sp. FP2]